MKIYTRGHVEKLKKKTCRRNIKKYSFKHRSIDICNSLDAEVVQRVKSLHKFKTKIDNNI